MLLYVHITPLQNKSDKSLTFFNFSLLYRRFSGSLQNRFLELNGSVAQMEEHLTFNQGVAGPSPARPTIHSHFFGDLFV